MTLIQLTGIVSCPLTKGKRVMDLEKYQYQNFPLINESQNEKALESNKLTLESQCATTNAKLLAKQYLKRVDQDGDGFVSKREATNAVLDAYDSEKQNIRLTVDPEYVHFLQIIKDDDTFKSLAKVSKDESQRSADTKVSLKDFEVLEEWGNHMSERLNSLSKRISLLESFAKRRFTILDKDHDGLITRKQLDNELENPNLQDRSAREINNLRSCFNAIDCYSTTENGQLKGAISESDLNQFISRQHQTQRSWHSFDFTIELVRQRLFGYHPLYQMASEIESPRVEE